MNSIMLLIRMDRKFIKLKNIELQELSYQNCNVLMLLNIFSYHNHFVRDLSFSYF